MKIVYGFLFLFFFFTIQSALAESNEINRSAEITNSLSGAAQKLSSQVFVFYDPFSPLQDIDSPDELREAVANILFPADEYSLTNGEPAWKKKYRFAHGIRLMTDKELFEYSEKSFRKYAYQSRTGKLYFTPEERKHLHLGFEEWDTRIVMSGWISFRGGYGSFIRNENYQDSFTAVDPGFNLNQDMKVNVAGKIGDRISVNINHSSGSPDNEYEVAYRALDTDDSLLRELRAGNVALNIPQSSHFLKYNGTSKDSYGLKAVFQKNDWSAQTVLSLTKSKKGYKKFVGRRRQENLSILDVNYSKRKYYILPDKSIDPGSLSLYQSVSSSSIADKVIDSRYFKRMVEGEDFFINRFTGELTLKNSLDRGTDLLVRYTSGGSEFTTNPDSIIGVENSTGSRFLYLWKSDKNFSQYIHYGYYNLGFYNFDPTRGFTLSVVYTADKTKLADIQFQPKDYQLSPVNGTLKFYKGLPFPDKNGRIYTNASDPTVDDSIYTLAVTLQTENRTYTLDYGIIPGTERIYLNGRQLSSTEYSIVFSTGELFFKNTAALNDNDIVEAYYEYKPFFSGSQKVSGATRLDWKPSKIINMGSTLIYNVSQRDAGAPNISATPESVFLADLDGSLNIARLLQFSPEYELTVKGEAALSVWDPNSVDYAIIDDFENVGENYSFSKFENLWILNSPSTNIPGIYYTNRGALLYKDYRAYNYDGSYNLIYYNAQLTPDKIKDYSFKPGPYQALGGHLSTADYPNVIQDLLAFDYDFGQDGNWVGAAYSIGGPAGVDLSGYNEITVWAKLEGASSGDSVELYVGVGQINEDADGNGLLDAELDRSQPGYDFHGYSDHSSVVTHVGRGRLGEGDGYIQTEDLNGNGVLDTNENLAVFPGAGTTDVSNIIVTSGEWQKITMNIKSLTGKQVDAIQHASSLAVYVKKKSGTKGRLLIDTLDFRRVAWKIKKVDRIQVNDSPVIQGDWVSVFNNPFYSANRFYVPDSSDSNTQDRAKVFEKLHGPKTVSEASQFNEKSILINYQLTNVGVNTNVTPADGGTSGTLVKRNIVAINISRYRFLNYYIFVPDKDENGLPLKSGSDTFTNEQFVFIIGNTERSYYKWRIPLDKVSKNAWHSVRVNIFEGLKMFVDGNEISGCETPSANGRPNLQDINYLEMGVETTSLNEPVNNGIVWVDELYVNSDTSVIGTAYYVNPAFEYKKPLLAFGDFELLGPLSIETAYENKDFNFISSEGGKAGAYDNLLNASYRSSVFKEINYSVTYAKEGQGTSTNTLDMPDYLQWQSERETMNWALFYAGRDYIPAVNHSFTETFESKLSRNIISDTNDDSILSIQEKQYGSSAKIDLVENIPVMSAFVLTPRFGFEDSLFLSDLSDFTNGDDSFYLTNYGAYGMRSLKKSLTSGLNIGVWVFNLGGEFLQSIEKFSKVADYTGYRSELDSTKNKGVFERYGNRVQSMSQGFRFPDEKLDKANSDSYKVSLSGDRPLPFFSFWLSDRIGRSADYYGYDDQDNLISKNENYSLGDEYKLHLYPKLLKLDTIQFRLKRDSDMSYDAFNRQLGYSNALTTYGQVYYRDPFYYMAVFDPAYGRTNSLNLIREYSGEGYNSTSRYVDYFGTDLILEEFDGPWRVLIPRRYGASTTLDTRRTYSSYYQKRDNTFDIWHSLKVSEWGLFNPENGIRPGDLNLGTGLKNAANYNERRITDTISGTANETFYFPKNANFLLSYTLAYSSDSFISNREAYEADYGFPSDPPGDSPVRKYSHSIGGVFNWIIDSWNELNFLLFQVNIKGSSINNRESLTYSWESIQYDGLRFVRYTEKVYEAVFEHNTDLQLSDYLIMGILMKTALNQYADVTPAGDGVQRTLFRPGFGFQFAFDMKIRF